MEAYEEKKGMTIRMLKMQLAHNVKIEGGFIPALARLIPLLTGTVLPALGAGALSGLASTSVKKTNRKRIVSSEGRSSVSDRN